MRKSDIITKSKKTNIMKKILSLLMALAMISIAFTSCDDDDEGGDIIVSKDGVYISGAATGSIDVKFDDALVEGASYSSYERAGMYEIYYYLVAGELEIKSITDGVETIYGPASSEEVTLDGTDADQITATFTTGTMASGSTVYSITEDGFYHVLFDETSLRFWVVPVLKWEWVYDDVELDMSAGASAAGVTWTKTDVKFPTHQSKVRYDDGWKVVTDLPILPENDELTDNDYVIFFTNLGFNDDGTLEPGAGYTDVEKGMYDITLSWTPAQKFTITLNKTGDVQNTDYSGYTLGMIGNGIVVADTNWGWSSSYQNQTPTQDGEIYTWEWDNVTIAANGSQEYSWKFREGDAWDFTLGYNDVTLTGGAAADFFAGSSDGNFGVAEQSAYDFILIVDADDDSWTLTVNAAGEATPEMYMVGDGCSAGWDATAALPMSGTDGVYTLTTTLSSGGYIKFLTTSGSWAPMYGTDSAGTSSSGNLVYRATEADADPSSIPCPDTDGTYTVSINTTDLTYTIVAAK